MSEVAVDRDGGHGKVEVPITLRTASRIRASPRRSTAGHLAGGPALDVALGGSDAVDHRLARVGALERALELALDPKTDHGEFLL